MPEHFNDALPRSQFVTNLAQEVLAPLDLVLVFDTLRGEPVHHAQDASPLVRLGQNDLRGVRRGEKMRQTSGTIFSVFSTFRG